MQIKLNGATELVPDNSTVQDVLAAKKLPEATAIIVLNDNIVRREEWQNLRLNSDDQLEVIRIIGGG